MKTINSLLALGLAGASAALPAGDAPLTSFCETNGILNVSYVAKFDNVNAGILADLPTRSISPLGVYDNLYFNLNNVNLGLAVTGVKTRSAPNGVSFDAIGALTEGKPSITSNYQDSITDHFALTSFYFGCAVTNVVTVASVPAKCTVTVTGFRSKKQVAQRTFTYKPTVGLLGAPSLSDDMVLATLGTTFSNVDDVTFTADGLVASTLEAVLIDNVAYHAFIKSGGDFIAEE